MAWSITAGTNYNSVRAVLSKAGLPPKAFKPFD
jgi:hypothetical protein